MNDDTVDATLRDRFSRQADALPGPDLADVRRRAERQAVPPRRRRSWQQLNVRWAFAVAVALVAGSGFGFALGSSSTPAVASGPVELGFLPARGWSVLQAATRATRARPARQAIAANVPLRPEDDADGIPYATLLGLPSNGVVVVASFTPAGAASSPEAELPLRLRDATPHREAQLRPTNPLGQYRLRSDVNGYAVDVNVYFGTRRPAAAVITAAQHQLDRLVVRSVGASSPVAERALPMRPAATPGAAGQSTSRIIDRTFRCTPFALGDGLRDLNAIAWPLDSKEFQNPNPSPGYLGVSSGGFSPTSDLISVRADAWQRFRNRPRIPEGVYVHARRCSAARVVSIPLSPRGLPGPPVQFGDDASCTIRGRLLVRVRAVLQSAAPWQRIDRTYAGARRKVVEAAVAVKSESRRRPIAFIELGPGGKTRLWVSSGCT